MADTTDEETRYGYILPSDNELSARYKYLVEHWRGRNNYIQVVRDALGGKNAIEAPISVYYKVKVLHSYILAALLQEKVSRFLPIPTIQIIPDDTMSLEDRIRADAIEEALNVLLYEMERRNDGDVWPRVASDAIMLDEGVERIQRAPEVFWPELYLEAKEAKQADEEGESYTAKYPLGSDARKEYKQKWGLPTDIDYVPLENFFPDYDGPKQIQTFEVSERSLSAVRSQPIFQDSKAQQVLNDLDVEDQTGGLSTKVLIVQYTNLNWHCWYSAGIGPNTHQTMKSGSGAPLKLTDSTELKYLYGYEHGLGETLYNSVPGRYGGWKTSTNRIEGVGMGLLELSQASDELLSQVFTNIRARNWPNPLFKMDPELRGWGTDQSKAQAPKFVEGEAIVLYTSEEVRPIFEAQDDPTTEWAWGVLKEQIGNLGGSAIAYGQRPAGVDTGYQQALQTTQAESLDERIEQNLAGGAIRRATKLVLHMQQIGEEVYMHQIRQDSLTGKSTGKLITLDPKDTVPLPRMSAQVRKQRPIDYVASLAAAKQASDDRQGKGPLLSDYTIRTQILSVEKPDTEHTLIMIEAAEQELIASGVITNKITEAMNVKLAKQSTPDVSPEMMGKADPALLAAVQSGTLQGAAQQQGGTSPDLLAGTAEAAGIPPGPVAGNPEMGNRVGEAAQGAVQTGAASI